MAQLIDYSRTSRSGVVSGFGRAPYGVYVGSKGHVYLALGLEDTILVTDAFAKSEHATITGVEFPVGVAVNSDESRLYASCYFDKSIAVVDLSGPAVVGKIAVDLGPYGVALSADGSALYAAHFPYNTVSVIDVERGAVTDKIPVAKPRGVALSRAGDRLT
ncbi:YncE family protein [Streptomyces sp. NPDC005141]